MGQDVPNKLNIININEDLIKMKELLTEAESLLEEDEIESASLLIAQAEDISENWPDELLERVDVQLVNQQIKELIEDAESTNENRPLKYETTDILMKQPSLEALRVIQRAELGLKFDFPIDLNEYVLGWIEIFTSSKKGYVERSLSRATPYMSMIKKVFKEEGIPEDLIYLALIESGYINAAKSRASAVGMWQFIRSTGRMYGLKQNKWVDERRDPEKSTRASARYLRRLYELMGDWYLATASYNAGPFSLERAIRETGSSNFWDLYRSPWLRDETKHYVPKLCAAILVSKNPSIYGYVYEILPELDYETITIKTQTRLSYIAQKSRSSVDEIKKLNPELLTNSTPPGIYQIKVPKGTGDVDLTLPKAPIKTPAKKLKKNPSLPSNKTS
jgi:membrane-bound lytic murein transglycosylase D